MTPPKVFEFWGGPLCGEVTVYPDDRIATVQARDGWYIKVCEQGQYWCRWTGRFRAEAGV